MRKVLQGWWGRYGDDTLILAYLGGKIVQIIRKLVGISKEYGLEQKEEIMIIPTIYQHNKLKYIP